MPNKNNSENTSSKNSASHALARADSKAPTQASHTHKSKYDVIALVGPQGSGKTTQLKKILKKTDADFAAVGDILRSILLTSDNLNEELRQAKTDMLAGRMLNDDVTFNALMNHFAVQREAGGTKHVLIFDGFPRSDKQVHHLFELGRAYHGRDPKVGVIRINLTPEASKKRCLDRAESARRSGGPVRPDDTDEAIQQRLAIYFERMHMLENLLKEKSAEIHDFHGHHGEGEVHSRILEDLFHIHEAETRKG